MTRLVQADSERLRLAAEAMQAFHALLSGSLHDIGRAGAGLLDAIFSGQAQALMQAELRALKPHAARLVEQLQQLALRLVALRERLLAADALAAPAAASPNPEFADVASIASNGGVGYEQVSGRPFIAAGGEQPIHDNDVAQGAIGDCYLMGALAAMARTERGRSILQDMVRRNPDGAYTVRLYSRGGLLGLGDRDPVEISISPEFPLREDGTPVFAQLGDRDRQQAELWTMLVEKAYAQYYGGYDDIVQGFPGSVLEELTGVESTVISAAYVDFAMLAERFAAGDAIAVSTLSDAALAASHPLYTSSGSDPHLVANHVFYVSDIDRAGKTVTLRNPWGYQQQPVRLSYSEFKMLLSSVAVNSLQRAEGAR